MTSSNITEHFADFLIKLRPEDVPQATSARCIDLLIDHLAVSIAGMRLPWSQALVQYAREQQAVGAAVIYGAHRSTADIAALVNGTMAHGIELDDTHEASVSHPGAVIFAVVLALAQERGSSPQDAVCAVVAGYEAMGRIGSAFDSDFMARGSHPTANHGVFGACAAAARLIGLTAAELDIAWGIAASLNSGSMAFTEDPMGTMVKRLHAGWPAHSGIVAAKLAKLGFTGPRGTLDRSKGYIGRNSPDADKGGIVKNLGERWVVDEISIKPYACCRLFHSAIDAIEQLKTDPDFSVENIAGIKASGSRHMIDGHMEYRPRSVMSAQYSLPFSLAVALRGDAGDPMQYSEHALNDASTLKIADLVTGVVSEDLDKLFPAKYAGAIELLLHDGRSLSCVVLDCSGSAANPLDRQAIIRKFRLLTAKNIDSSRQAAVLECAEGFLDLEDVRRLSRLLEETTHETR